MTRDYPFRGQDVGVKTKSQDLAGLTTLKD